MLLAGHFYQFSIHKSPCILLIALYMSLYLCLSETANPTLTTQKIQTPFFAFAVFLSAAPLRDTLNLSECWASNLCPQWILNSLSEKQIGSINIWKRDNRDRMICDILQEPNLELIHWQSTRDWLSLKARQLLAASFHRGSSLYSLF